MVILRAAGNIDVAGHVNINGTSMGANGGFLSMESFMGSVDITARLDARAGAPGYYAPDESSTVVLRAAEDVTLAGELDKGGAQWGGYLNIDAGRDVLVKENVNLSAGGMPYADGGNIDITAGRDLVIAKRDGSGKTRIVSIGGSDKIGYDGYADFYGGQGGYLTFLADGDLTIEDQVRIEASSALRQGLSEGYPYGGNIYAIAGGTVTVGGELVSQGSGFIGEGRFVRLEGTAGLTLLPSADINVRSNRAGEVRLVSDGPMQLDGRVDTRSNVLDGTNFFAGYYGYGGSLLVYGMADVRVGGKLLTGSDGYGDDLSINVCRLTIESGGSLDHTLRDSQSYEADDNVLTIRESMSVEPGGEVLASGVDGGKNIIRFRDAAKPPILDGTVDPAPIQVVDPSLVGCPVCGNAEIDQGESCDDGNTVSGDGCRDDCQDEGCLAATPGFPGVDLCDDGDACTIDVCDPVAHSCSNIASCEEGVECTVDACVSGACEHVPDDTLCDDGDECTDDICNATSGCVFANLTGPSCEDGDLCTVTGVCDMGVCEASDPSLSGKNKIVIKLKPGTDDDRLSAKAELPLTDFSSDLTVTGLELVLRDGTDQTFYTSSIPAAAFDASGSGYRFRDSGGEVASANGVSSVKISNVVTRGVAKVRAKARDVDLSGAQGQLVLSLSLLFGSDPALDECVTARRVPCKGTDTKTICK